MAAPSERRSASTSEHPVAAPDRHGGEQSDHRAALGLVRFARRHQQRQGRAAVARRRREVIEGEARRDRGIGAPRPQPRQQAPTTGAFESRSSWRCDSTVGRAVFPHQREAGAEAEAARQRGRDQDEPRRPARILRRAGPQ